MSHPPIRLTELAHGGGCGCKLAPSVLQQLLAGQPQRRPMRSFSSAPRPATTPPSGRSTTRHCVIATTDFFMPMVDDPRDFGRIAAANALSDVYAMGGKPIMALAILGMPLGKLPVETVREILQGGASICAEAGIPVAGGHSIDAPEPIYGLAVIGLCSPENIRRNSGARPGDALILTKGIGVGIYSAAFKKRALPDDAYARDDRFDDAAEPGRPRAGAGRGRARHDGRDRLRPARPRPRTGARRRRPPGHRATTRIPFLAQAEALAEAGYVTGASGRNWDSYGDQVVLPPELPAWRRACSPTRKPPAGCSSPARRSGPNPIRATIEAAGYPRARIIGCCRCRRIRRLFGSSERASVRRSPRSSGASPARRRIRCGSGSSDPCSRCRARDERRCLASASSTRPASVGLEEGGAVPGRAGARRTDRTMSGHLVSSPMTCR